MQEADTTNHAADEDAIPAATASSDGPDEQSPPSNPSEARSKPNSTPIFVDSRGVHDFDLKNRVKGPRKLTKLTHRVSQPLSPSAMPENSTGIPRSGSDVSEPASIRKRLSSFMTSPVNPSYRLVPLRSSSVTIVTRTPALEDDPLSDDKKELESRLNYHLAELDELKRVVRSHNEIIKTADSRLKMIQSRNVVNQSISIKKLIETVETAIDNRDAYAKFVNYHRDQLDRIKQKRLVLDKEAGVESPTAPEVFDRIWQYDDWAVLFSLGR